MSIEEIQSAILELPVAELDGLASWIEEYKADLWDQKIEQDALAGRLDTLAEQEHREFEAGRYRPL